MSESRIVGTRGDTRSAMARVSDARPFKPYVYRGEPEPLESIQRRQRAQQAALQRQREREQAAEVAPDPAPGYEWRREQLAEDGDAPPAAGEAAPLKLAGPAAVVAPEPCQRCGELEAAIDGLKAEIRALIEEAARIATAREEPEPPPVRCRKCKYMTNTTGHRVMCDA